MQRRFNGDALVRAKVLQIREGRGLSVLVGREDFFQDPGSAAMQSEFLTPP